MKKKDVNVCAIRKKNVSLQRPQFMKGYGEYQKTYLFKGSGL